MLTRETTVIGASVSEPHTCDSNAADMCCNLFIYIYRTSKRPRGFKFITRGGAGWPIPVPYVARVCFGTAPASRPTVGSVDVGRETRQPIRATSHDRLSSDTSEEMEARLMSCAARLLIARATVLPHVCSCSCEAWRNTSSVACARAVVLHV